MPRSTATAVPRENRRGNRRSDPKSTQNLRRWSVRRRMRRFFNAAGGVCWRPLEDPMPARQSTDRSRRDFARLFAIGGSAALFACRADAWPVVPPEQAPANADERYWQKVRDAFIMPPGYVYLNAANLCPSSAAVLTATDAATRSVDADPSNQNRAKTRDGREATRADARRDAASVTRPRSSSRETPASRTTSSRADST